jgi:lysyl endopeptidase
LGAFTAQNNKENRSFGIAPVAGDFLILEYIEPLNRPTDFVPSSIIVSHIVHGFRPNPFSMKSGDSASGNCNFNVACSEGAGKNHAINSVALLISGNGAAFCSGAMVNNAENDGRQLFLTAEHCIGDSDVENFMVGFHYQYKYCNSVFETKPQTNTVHGTRLLGKSGMTDYAVLEVVESIPDEWDVFMSGWDATNTNIRTGSFYGIHHPSGDVKKVSLATSQLDLVRLLDIGKGVNFWRVSKWEKGVTEPGSSGSPLFDSNGLIIGHLLGGESACSRPKSPDYYGALSKDWLVSGNPITKYLNPHNKNLIQIQGAPLRQLRGNSEPISQPLPADPTVSTLTVTSTQSIIRTTTSTQTIAKTTLIVTSRATVIVTGPAVTITRDVFKTVTLPVTTTKTFTRIPPPIITTVFVTKR